MSHFVEHCSRSTNSQTWTIFLENGKCNTRSRLGRDMKIYTHKTSQVESNFGRVLTDLLNICVGIVCQSLLIVPIGENGFRNREICIFRHINRKFPVPNSVTCSYYVFKTRKCIKFFNKQAVYEPSKYGNLTRSTGHETLKFVRSKSVSLRVKRRGFKQHT
jgi:hypothetical protein